MTLHKIYIQYILRYRVVVGSSVGSVLNDSQYYFKRRPAILRTTNILKKVPSSLEQYIIFNIINI
jgi:hypothetical protein